MTDVASPDRAGQSFDPYAVLGIARTAPAAAVKLAYRTAARAAHPDRGGSPEAFIRIVRAFDLLNDPEARRLYDETGIVDEGGANGFRRDVARALADMFDAAIATASGTGLELDKVDFVAEMTKAVQGALAEARSSLLRADRDIRALATLQGRIRRTHEGRNIFGERIDAQIAARTSAQAQGRRRVLLLETALIELGNYASEVDLISALEAPWGESSS